MIIREDSQNLADEYDEMAVATGWRGPSIIFDLLSPYIAPGQTILDIGIGTGLSSLSFYKQGIRVIGLDIDPEMLESCRNRGVASEFVCHDLNNIPYPFDNGYCDHVVSAGVFQFFQELCEVFGEVCRVIKGGGIFVFITGDRRPDEDSEIVVEPEISGMDSPILMFRHTTRQITCWLEQNGFKLLNNRESLVYMDRQRTRSFPVRAYLAQKTGTGK